MKRAFWEKVHIQQYGEFLCFLLSLACCVWFANLRRSYTGRLAKRRGSDSKVAIKDIVRDEGDGLIEIEILTFLGRHDHIASMRNAFIRGRSVWIVLDLCEGGDLVEYFQRHPLSEDGVCRAFVGLLKALEFCHS